MKRISTSLIGRPAMRARAVVVFALGTVLFLPCSGSAAPIVFLAGLDDGFAGGVELASPSPEYQTSLSNYIIGAGGTPVFVGFDGLPHNAQVAHTFTGLPSAIIAATLELRVRGGVPPGVESDGLVLSFIADGGADFLSSITWVRTFGDFPGGGAGSVFADPDPGIATPGLVWDPGDEALLSLDLGALPLAGGGILDIIPLLNANQFLDVLVSDDSIADFYRLTLTVADIDDDGVSDLEDNCPFVPNGLSEPVGQPTWGSQTPSTQYPDVGCACLCGDPNRDCQINVGDAPEAQRAGLFPPLAPLSPFFDIAFCDINSDGQCNVGDAPEMQRAGLFPPLPPLSPSFDVTGCIGYQGP